VVPGTFTRPGVHSMQHEAGPLTDCTRVPRRAARSTCMVAGQPKRGHAPSQGQHQGPRQSRAVGRAARSPTPCRGTRTDTRRAHRPRAHSPGSRRRRGDDELGGEVDVAWCARGVSLVSAHGRSLQDAGDVPKLRATQVVRNTHVRSAASLLGRVHVLARAVVAMRALRPPPAPRRDHVQGVQRGIALRGRPKSDRPPARTV